MFLPQNDLETVMTLMPRDVAARLGHETLEILRVRSYQAPSGRVVDLGAAAGCRSPRHC